MNTDMTTARTVVRFPSAVFILACFLAIGPVFAQKAATSDKHVVVISMDG